MVKKVRLLNVDVDDITLDEWSTSQEGLPSLSTST
jgi:hypothetical protein